MSTWSIADSTSGPGALCARLEALGAPGVAIASTLTGDLLAALSPELLIRRDHLPVLALEHPCPRQRSGWAPRLACEDREERRAAAAAVRTALTHALDLGARVLVLRLGSLDVRHHYETLARSFARRTIDQWQLAHVEEDRARLSPRALDFARFGLEQVLAPAEAAGVTLALANRGRWFEIPDDPEIGVLLADFRGAPLAPWLDPAAVHAREALGEGTRLGAWLAEHGARAAGVWLTDACGLHGGLPWGRGEVDTAAIAAALSPTSLRIVHCRPAATDDELRAALVAQSSAAAHQPRRYAGRSKRRTSSPAPTRLEPLLLE